MRRLVATLNSVTELPCWLAVRMWRPSKARMPNARQAGPLRAEAGHEAPDRLIRTQEPRSGRKRAPAGQIRGPVCDVSSSARHPVCPRPHRFWAADQTAQLQLIAVPGGIQDYFHEISTASALANSRVTSGNPRLAQAFADAVTTGPPL
jgi:hypothetical protein